MIESIIVGALVAGAAAYAGRRIFRPARPKSKASAGEAGCSCPGCPSAKGRDGTSPRAGQLGTTLG
jgi:hypothetical protein